ncbi:MAG: hypothetical protein FWD46_07125 [Cystobacterineae bacterium]|nr:hypothetical protein [Cystobacterineae bacterium]
MYTVIETSVFQRYADAVWSNAEREAFIHWLAAHPFEGNVIPGTGGLRKVRWGGSGAGKRGGTRVIYYNLLQEGQIWLLMVYAKSALDNLPSRFLKQLKEELGL